jgi:hypothetical protein
MNKAEARELLEGLDFCMTHLVQQERSGRSRKLVCPECQAEIKLRQQAKIAEAISIIREKTVTASPSIEQWIPCLQGSLPKENERVWIAFVGFREKDRPGGKERYTTNSKPQFWKKISNTEGT